MVRLACLGLGFDRIVVSSARTIHIQCKFVMSFEYHNNLL